MGQCCIPCPFFLNSLDIISHHLHPILTANTLCHILSFLPFLPLPLPSLSSPYPYHTLTPPTLSLPYPFLTLPFPYPPLFHHLHLPLHLLSPSPTLTPSNRNITCYTPSKKCTLIHADKHRLVIINVNYPTYPTHTQHLQI